MRSKRFKAFKKGMTWTIVFLLLFSSLPVISNGAASNESTLRDTSSGADAYLWTEGEDYLSVSPGGYYRNDESQASGGKYLALHTNTPDTSATAEYQVDIPETGSYDIWVLATGMSLWMSAYSWKLDEGIYHSPPVVTEGAVFASEGMPFYWHQLDSTELTQGQHNLAFLTNAPRQGANDSLYNQGIDAIAVVPVDWEWQPDGLSKPTAPIVPEPSDEENYLWMEGENAHSAQGGYHGAAESQASGSTYLLLQTNTPGTSATAQYQVDIPETGSYDIWALATGLSIWMSPWNWKLDEGSYTTPPVVTDGSIFVAEGMPFYWHKLSSADLSQGQHDFTFLTNTPRQGASDGLYNHGIDAIAVVPALWGWQPNGLSKPFDKAAVKYEYVTGALDKSLVNREEQVGVTVTNKAIAPVNASLSFFVELVYEGEVVSRAVKEFNKTSWTAGEEHTETIQLTVPFNAPKGKNEIRTGIVDISYDNAVNGEKSVKVGHLNIEQEETNAAVPMLKATIANLQVQPNQASPRSYAGNVTYALNQAVDFDTTGYLSLYKGDVLWYVAEIAAVNTSELQANVEAQASFSFTLPEGVPADSYTVAWGLHKLQAEQETAGQVEVTVAASNTDYKPLTHGTFTDEKLGQSHFWYANQSHTMIWDGKPFVPIGGMFTSDYLLFYSKTDPAINKANWDKDVEVLQYMKAHGAMDMYINTAVMEVPAWAWQKMLDYLDQEGFTYGLQVQGAQGLTLSAYMPRAYEGAGVLKKENIVDSGEVTLTVPTFQISGYVDAMSALYVVMNPTTGEVIQSGEENIRKVDSATLELHANVVLPSANQTAYTVYFTPKVKYSGHTLRNIWDAGDLIINSMVDTLSKVTWGPNFRLFVDPVTNESGIYNGDEGYLFDSPIYSSQFVDWLKQKYNTLDALNEAWKMSSPVESYETAARLVPIVRGEGSAAWNNQLYLVDKGNPGSTYAADAYRGVLWDDFVDFREGSYNDYLMRFSDAITNVVDVPVVFKLSGTTRKYFINDKQTGGFAGVGGEIYGDNEYLIRERSGYTYSQIEQSAQTLWFLTTETQLDENMDRKYQSGEKGYPDKETMFNHFDRLLEAGSKGIYDFLFNCDYFTSCQEAYGYYTAKPIQFDWLKEYKDAILAPDSLAHIETYRPEVYYVYPAGETWWMLNRRNVVLPGNDYRGGATLQTFDNKWVVPTFDPNIATKVLVVSLEDDPATTIYGEALLAQGSLKAGKRNTVYMGYRKNLGALPEIDSYFTNEFTVLENGTKVQVLNSNATSTTQVLYSSADGKPWGIRDGKLWIITDPNWIQSFNGNEPKGQIKYLDQLDFSTDSSNGGNNGSGGSNGNMARSIVSVENGKAIVKLSNDQSVVSIPLAQIGDHPLSVVAGSVIVNVDRELLNAWRGQIGNEAGAAIEAQIKPVSEAGDNRSASQSATAQITIAGQVYEISMKLKKTDGSVVEVKGGKDGVEITLPYDADGVDEELLGIYYYNELTKVWEYVGGKVNSSAKTLTVKLRHLSKYAVLEYNKTFSDLLTTHWATRTIQVLSAKHIVNGVNDSMFKPAGDTTRAEFVSLLVRALNLEASEEVQLFKDVKEDAWYAANVQAAVKAGIVSGISLDSFAPNALITRAEMAVLVARALGLNKDTSMNVEFADAKDIPVWAMPSVAAMNEAALVQGKGDNMFHPRANATRAEAAQFILIMINQINKS